mgnify:FL=1
MREFGYVVVELYPGGEIKGLNEDIDSPAIIYKTDVEAQQVANMQRKWYTSQHALGFFTVAQLKEV